MVVFDYFMLMLLSLATFLISLRRVNRAVAGLCFSLFVLVILSLCVLVFSNQKTRSVG